MAWKLWASVPFEKFTETRWVRMIGRRKMIRFEAELIRRVHKNRELPDEWYVGVASTHFEKITRKKMSTVQAKIWANGALRRALTETLNLI